LLSDEFKQSLKSVIKDINGVDLTDEQLHKLFVEKKLDISNKKITLSYDAIYTKW